MQDKGRVVKTRPSIGIGSRRRELGSRIRHPGAPSRRRAEAVREFISRYGLIAILLVLPVAYGIQDLSDDGNLNRLGNNLVEGVSNGAILALIALGYTLVYGIIELINFAHGEVFMLGSLTAAALYSALRPHAQHQHRRAGARPAGDPGHLRCSPAARST